MILKSVAKTIPNNMLPLHLPTHYQGGNVTYININLPAKRLCLIHLCLIASKAHYLQLFK